MIRVLSLVRGFDAGAPRLRDPGLDLNAHAIADEIDLTLVLKDRGVELGLAGTAHHVDTIAGVTVPASEPAVDLRGLVASGVRVLAVRGALGTRGLRPADLLDGVAVIDESELAPLLLEHDVTLTTSG